VIKSWFCVWSIRIKYLARKSSDKNIFSLYSQNISPYWISADDNNMKSKENKRKETTHNNLYWFIYRNKLYPILDQQVKFN